MAAAAAAPDTFVDSGAEEFLGEPPVLLARWRDGRRTLAKALAGVPAGQKIPWYVTAMSPISMATARVMETWAHGLDIADALALTPVPTMRLRHIAHLGHRTYGHSFLVNGLPAPTTPVRLALTAPDGTLWTFGPEDAPDRVTGPALDFCLLVTQRRHRDDVALAATGPSARRWLDLAQAFAGLPGTGRPASASPTSSGTGEAPHPDQNKESPGTDQPARTDEGAT